MSFVSVGRLLPRAFDRIDRAKKIRDAQAEKQITKIFSDLFPSYAGRYSAFVRGSAIVVATDSPTLKHKIYTSQEKILRFLKEINARSIIFTPKQ